MGKLDRLRVTRRDDHTRADADFIEQLLRKAKGHDTPLRLPSLTGVMRSPRMAPSTFVAPGKLVQIRHCSAPRRLIARSFEMRCTVPRPDAERLGNPQDTHALRKLLSNLPFRRPVYLRPAHRTG